MNHNLIEISSIHKADHSPSNSEFFVNLKNSHTIQSIKRVVVKQISIPNVFYNIYEANRYLTYKVGVTDKTISIPEGQYTYDLFKVALEAEMVAEGVSITLDSLTSRVTLAQTTPIEYYGVEDGKSSNGLAEVLGLIEGSGALVSSYTGTGIINLSGIQEVYIASLQLAHGNNLISSDTLSEPVICVVPMTGGFGEVVHYVSSHEELDEIQYPRHHSGKSLQNIDIRVLDKYGNLLNLRGHNINIILKIYHN